MSAFHVIGSSTPGGPDDPPFDFEVWKARRAEQRQARRAELETALAAGKVVVQRGTFWTIDACITNTFTPGRAFRVFIDRCQTDPKYLAAHLESREYGFGFPTFIVTTKGHSTP